MLQTRNSFGFNTRTAVINTLEILMQIYTFYGRSHENETHVYFRYYASLCAFVRFRVFHEYMQLGGIIGAKKNDSFMEVEMKRR